MKVGLLCYCRNIFESDGNTVRAKRVLNELNKVHEVMLVSLGKGEAPQSENLVLLAPRWRKLWNLWLATIILRNRFDCIYCSNDWRGFFTAYLFSKFPKVVKYKVIFEAHSIVSETTKNLEGKSIKFRLSRLVEKLVIGHADYVITLSPNTLETYCRYNKNIEMIPVFVDEDLFKRSEGTKRKQHDIKSQLKYIGLIGPFGVGANKGFLEFIAGHQVEFDPRIRFVGIGKCERELTRERIIYTGYLSSVQDYITQLTRLDAVLIPSVFATTGPCNKILEAMFCSLPVFTTPKGMVALYYLEPGRDIFVFEEKELPSKINELIFDEALMRQVGNSARKAVERYYSKKVNRDKIVKVIHRVCNVKKQPATKGEV